MNSMPDAVKREHERQLARAAALMRTPGEERQLHVTGLADFPDAPQLLIPVINAHIQPDLFLESPPGQESIVGFVPPVTCFADESCGERWKEAVRWADDHQARVVVLVDAAHQEKAVRIAQKWKLPASLIQVMH